MDALNLITDGVLIYRSSSNSSDGLGLATDGLLFSVVISAVVTYLKKLKLNLIIPDKIKINIRLD